ncbi:hypothetical protein BJ322DRAFT_1036609 [Thelephora terrestris]|uniref:Uncharacterized protein n=1 Tax=Thelephora terrestris TaxID=56493 RepID=A0A9P6LB30_9AGAM|nr:hypothetical protein BJ322DRAFT_1036609 [Thelephora terrestris]
MAFPSPKNKKGYCDYCQQKPKHGNHDYCGKTCSQQASTMNQNNPVVPPQPQPVSTHCKQCGQNPKFQNFDFCGKHCASTWQLIHGSSNGKPNPPAKNSQGGAYGISNGAPNPPAKNSLGGNLGVTANMQLPNQLLGQVPQHLQGQVQAILPALVAALQQQGQSQPQQQQQPPPGAGLNTNNVIIVPPTNVPQQPMAATTFVPNNANKNQPRQTNVGQGIGPGFPVPSNAQGPVNGTNMTMVPTSAPARVRAASLTSNCRLAGCGKPVHTDPTSNHASEYCSNRHREEAVTTGQVTPCIMCLKMPRTRIDHFCSKACRDAALSQ